MHGCCKINSGLTDAGHSFHILQDFPSVVLIDVSRVVRTGISSEDVSVMVASCIVHIIYTDLTVCNTLVQIVTLDCITSHAGCCLSWLELQRWILDVSYEHVVLTNLQELLTDSRFTGFEMFRSHLSGGSAISPWLSTLQEILQRTGNSFR